MSMQTYFESETAVERVADRSERTPGHFWAVRTEVDDTLRFEPHAHEEDQLAWAPRGTMEVVVAGERWHLHPGHVCWLPAGITHEMTLLTSPELISLYASPELRPNGERWDQPRVLPLDPLGAALLTHLGSASPDPARRRRCHDLLLDVLASATDLHDALALPRDPRARAVAEAVLADPADVRDLAEWAAGSDVSAKTLGRLFVAETGRTFGRWRTRARMSAAVRMLSEGEPVQRVSPRVGYATPSGFIGAFREAFGITPAAYARQQRGL
ncbi:helix-turn-helix domain-containing protein [Plantibacter sp. YIM 135347]|uniref:helix-turn-helix domain-containing protein n=1 Tax=Plantibacter sp. YIM 135347 TaxID=3423919 RepID=UPI003D33735D